MNWVDHLVGVLSVVGAGFVLLAALGSLRFPDFFSRMHAVSKATCFGAGFLLLAFVATDLTWAQGCKSAAVLLFLFMTTPVSAQALMKSKSRP